MRKMKSLVLAVMGLLCGMSVSAEDFEADGIYYDITSQADKTVAVTCRGNYSDDYSNEYSGEVKIPKSVTYNGHTYSVTSIGNSAFYYCSSLTSVEIPNSVTSIGWYAFSDCSSLTSVEIPNSVTSIGDYAFQYCSSLTSVEIPNSVTSIGSDAFYGTIWYNNQPDGVIYVGKVLYTYKGTMPANTSITIEDGTVSISPYAFDDCSRLTSIEIPNSVTSIGRYAFDGCSSLTSIVVAPNNPKYDSRDNCNAIIESESNTLIAGCQNTTIPNSVTSIGNGAFSGHKSLTSVELPNSVTSIGGHAFKSCSSLTSVEIPNSVTSIGDYAFYGCSSLPSVEIGNSVTSIGDRAFEGCRSLTSVEIPNSVTSIGDDAFYGCSSLTSVELPNSVTSIGGGAFGYCSSLTSIVVAPNNPKYDSRDNCNAIIESESNTLIAGCQNSTIPNSVTSIGNQAFWYCSSLTSVELPNSVTSIESWAFFYCSSLTSVEMGNSVTSIGAWAFEGCSSLTSVVIPNSVTSIESWAFSNCSSLTSVELPNSVTNIGYSAFYDCENLKKLISYAEVPPVCGSDVFLGVNTQKCTLQVPEKSISAYQQADQWKDFLFIEGVPTAIGGVTVDGAVPATADVYSTNGMLVKRNADLKNLKHELPAGIYIIGGKKVWVK